ncbi:MAG: hypothetical protein JW910_08730 [Anaerolineae bacterium]|nr:hypothetical protein [Anaerolineae bacterium]
MHIPRLLTALVAVIVLVIVVAVGSVLVQPPRALIVAAGFTPDTITPNADGDTDVAVFSYTLSRNATVSLTFSDAAGNDPYVFRDAQPRTPEDYQVLFSGVVAGYQLEDETFQGEVETRLLPDGDYTWTLTATDEAGEVEAVTGTLAIREADADLPDLIDFDVSHEVFTPNQDGIDDRLTVHVTVVKESTLNLYLLDDDANRYYIAEAAGSVNIGEAGRHTFDWDGGIDTGADPPPDGTYQLVLEAEDAEGQRVYRTGSVGIADSGIPYGAIYPQPTGTTVFYDSMPYDPRYHTSADAPGDLIALPEGIESAIGDDEVVVQGDLLIFRLTVINDGPVGLRTTGPPPGTAYEQDQFSSSLGWYEESGAWRIGFECDTIGSSYPWRWAIGSADELVTVEQGGRFYSYLPPGEQAVVWGAVRLTEIVTSRNPQPCWFGLIHEDVEVAEANVDRRWVQIVPGPEGVSVRLLDADQN